MILTLQEKANLEEISKIAKKAGIENEYIENYGKYKAKVNLKLLEKMKNKQEGKLILVTAVNPTPMGEGKTTASIGISDGLNRLGKNQYLHLENHR